MKSTLILVLILFLSFTSCKKSNIEQTVDSEDISMLEAQIEEDENTLNLLTEEEAIIDSLSKEIELLLKEIE